MQIIQKIHLDMSFEYAQRHRFRQFDTNTNVLEFFITNNNKALNLRDVEPYVYFKKSDNRVVFVKVNEKDFVDSSTFKVVLTNNILAAAGPLKAEITLMKKSDNVEESKILTTNKVNFYVEPILRDDTAIESTNEFLGIQEILDKINNVDDIVSKLENLHNHSNLELLETLTQEKLEYWDNKADVLHSHEEYVLATDAEQAFSNVEDDILALGTSIDSIKDGLETNESKINAFNEALENLDNTVQAGIIQELSDEELDEIIDFLNF